jgi:hypothetical protein
MIVSVRVKDPRMTMIVSIMTMSVVVIRMRVRVRVYFTRWFGAGTWTC